MVKFPQGGSEMEEKLTQRPVCLFALWLVLFTAAGTESIRLFLYTAVGAGLVLLLWWMLVCRPRVVVWLTMAAALCAALPGCWVQGNTALHDSQYFADRTGTLTALVLDHPSQTESGSWMYPLQLRSIEDDQYRLDANFQVRLYSQEPLEVDALDLISVRAELFAPSQAYFEGGFDSRQYYRSKGVLLMASTRPELCFVIRHDAGGIWRSLVLSLRDGVRSAMDGLAQPAQGLMRGILLGDKSMLDADIEENFSHIGISHILAVSGMHLSILAGMVQLIMVRLLGRRRMGAVAVMLVTLLYGGVTGFSVSVVRSLVMHWMMCGAILLMRDYDGPTALSLGVSGILLANPFGVWDVGLQLSALSTLGILTLAGPIGRVCKHPWENRKGMGSRVARGIVDGAAVTAASLIMTAPLLLLYFGRLSFVSFAGNLLIVPVIPLLFVLGACCCIPLVAGLAALAVQAVSAYVVWMSSHLADIPFLAWETRSLNAVWASAFVLVVVCVLRLFPREQWRWKPLAIGGVLVGVSLLLAPSTQRMAGEAEVCAIDVAQGDCLWMRTAEGSVMVDCGTSSGTMDAGERAVDFMQYYGENRLDCLILTHYHTDHISGLPTLCERLEIGCVVAPPDDGSENSAWVHSLLQQQGIPLIEAQQDITVPDVPGMEVRVLTQHIDRTDVAEGNEQCLGADITLAGKRVIAVGDVEWDAELNVCDAYEVDAHILKVSHHGSGSSSAYRFLEEVSPEVAIISCKANNSYGHPAIDVLYRLAAVGAEVVRTDEQGSIRMAISQGQVRVIQGTGGTS